MLKKQIFTVTVLTLIILTALSASAFAHRMLIRPIKPGLIQIVFDDNTGAAGVEVIFYDEDNEEILQGTSDQDGNFAYEANLPVELVVVNDGVGHRATWIYGTEAKEELPLPLRVGLGLSIIAFIGVFFQLRSKNNRKK
jgi:hypothetical protein